MSRCKNYDRIYHCHIYSIYTIITSCRLKITNGRCGKIAKLNNKDKRAAVTAAVLIACAFICRVVNVSGFYMLLIGLIRSAVYLFLFTAWGVLLKRRIIQVQLRRYMIGIVGLIVFWFLLRTIKFNFITAEKTPALTRFIWYSYYIPMLMIPMLSLLAAISLGKPEQYRTPLPLRLMWIPTILLVLIVLTNDFHHMVFSFPSEYPIHTDSHYNYETVYWVILVLIAVYAVFAFGIIVRKCRIPYSKKLLWLPMVPFLLMIAYGILSVTVWPVIEPFFGDITAVYCVLTAIVFECCIQCGLIQSNSRYVEMFRSSTVAAQITDKDLNVCYAAENAKSVEKHILERAKVDAVILDNGIRLCAEPISGGYVYWQEDISTMLTVIGELSGIREELKTYGGLLEEENKQKRRRKRLEEQKRLFERVQETIKPHIASIKNEAKKLQTAQTDDEAKRALGKLSVIGAYLKRRSNLIMLADNLGKIPSEELHLCLRESESNLSLYGVTCTLCFKLSGELPFGTAGTLFDFYEAVVELSLDTLTDMTVFAAATADALRITLILSCNTDMKMLLNEFENASVINEDDVWYCELTISGGGETV